jgi:hypothetical protein
MATYSTTAVIASDWLSLVANATATTPNIVGLVSSNSSLVLSQLAILEPAVYADSALLVASELSISAIVNASTPVIVTLSPIATGTTLPTIAAFEPAMYPASALLVNDLFSLTASVNLTSAAPASTDVPVNPVLNTQAFGVPEVVAQAVLSMGSVLNAQTFGNITALVTAALSPSPIINNQIFGAVSVSVAPKEVVPVPIVNASQVGAVSLSESVASSISLGSVVGSTLFGSVLVDEGSTDIFAASIVNSQEFGSIALEIQARGSIAPASIESTILFGAVNVPLIASKTNLMVSESIAILTQSLRTAQPVSLSTNTGMIVSGYRIAPLVTTFTPQPYHIKRYGVAIGSYDLSSQVTAVSAVKSTTEFYLSITIAGFESIDGITTNQASPLRFYTYWYNSKTGENEQESDLIIADFESITPYQGGVSRSLTVQARSVAVPGVTPVTIPVEDVEYIGGGQLRLPIMANLNVGDTVTHAYGSLVIDTITHTFGAYTNSMTLTGA